MLCMELLVTQTPGMQRLHLSGQKRKFLRSSGMFIGHIQPMNASAERKAAHKGDAVSMMIPRSFPNDRAMSCGFLAIELSASMLSCQSTSSSIVNPMESISHDRVVLLLSALEALASLASFSTLGQSSAGAEGRVELSKVWVM